MFYFFQKLPKVCIALANGLVQFYSHKKLVDEFHINGSILAMYFGKLGLEEQVLVLVTRSMFLKNKFNAINKEHIFQMARY